MLTHFVLTVVKSYFFANLWHAFARGLVGFIFIVQTAEQPVAGPGYLGRVEGQVP